MKTFLNEFKAFATRGNVVDLSVAVVVGAAFGKIVTSFTNDILMPPLGLLAGGRDFADLAWTLRPAHDGVAAVTIGYGAFVNTIVSFLIIAFALFLVVKAIHRFEHVREEAPAAPAPSREEVLLTEIRDLLKRA